MAALGNEYGPKPSSGWFSMREGWVVLLAGGVDLVLMVGGRCSRVSYPWDGSRGTWVSWPSPRALDGGVSTCPVP